MAPHLPIEPGTPRAVPLTSFIGRERLVASVAALLCREDVRLLTLTGTGGVGKTRLALRVAEEAGEHFPDGSFFVPLAAIEDPALVGATIGRAVEVPGPDDVPVVLRLAGFFAERRVLLVLDNFEHVVAAGPLVSDLLAACSSLTVLVTSRAVLRISAERTFAVPPLDVPDPSDEVQGVAASDDPNGLLASEALRLFVDRAQAARADFTAGPNDLPVIAAICRRLDGLPLAIELAAARIAILPPAALLARLDRRLPLLTGGARDLPTRQQTMRNAVAWSHDLLTPLEQALFRRLAVFVGGFSLEIAEEVVSATGDPGVDLLDGVAALAGSSLVHQTQDETGEPRFAMLETLREFGLEQLAASAEDEATRDGHAAAYVRFAERAEPGLSGADQVIWVARIEAELGNIRSALAWLQARGRAEAAMRLAGALSWIWQMPGLCKEGLDRLQTLATLPGAEQAPAPLADVVSAAANIATALGDLKLAQSLFERALELYRRLGDQPKVAGVLRGLGVVALDRDDPEYAARMLQEAVEIARETGATWEVAAATNHLGAVDLARGEYARAIERREEALAIWREIGGPAHVASVLLSVGWAAQVAGDRPRALDAYRQFVDLVQPLTDDWFISASLQGCAGLIAADDPARAVRLFAASRSILDRLGLPLRPMDRRIEDRMIAAARSALGEEAFAEQWAAGEAMSLDEAAAEVPAVVAAAPAAPASPVRVAAAAPHGLTPREIDVLRLVATGQSDREIGEVLFISSRTVSKHVESILGKLGVATRAAAASEAVRVGLA